MWQKIKKRVFVLFVCVCIADEKTMLSELAFHGKMQRWSLRGRPWLRGRPRGHILKSLALASTVKSLALASKPHLLEIYPVLGLRTALFV